MSKLVLVTGAATGIGAACASAFARAGWNVLAAYLPGEGQGDAVEAVVHDCMGAGVQARAVAVDVTQDTQCRDAAGLAAEAFGRLDALVNCAGTTRFIAHAQLDALSAAEFHRTYDVNVVGMFQMVRACADLLARDGAGSIVNISSIGGLHGLGSSIAYAASKGAVNTLTLALARALAPRIRVNAIAPGFVEGGLPSRVLSGPDFDRLVESQLASTVLGRVCQPREVADLGLFMCEKGQSMTGEIVTLDNGFHLKVGA